MKQFKKYSSPPPGLTYNYVLCSNQGCGSGAQAILDGWSRSQKFGFPFHRHSLSGKRVINITMIFGFQWTKLFSETGAKNF